MRDAALLPLGRHRAGDRVQQVLVLRVRLSLWEEDHIVAPPGVPARVHVDVHVRHQLLGDLLDGFGLWRRRTVWTMIEIRFNPGGRLVGVAFCGVGADVGHDDDPLPLQQWATFGTQQVVDELQRDEPGRLFVAVLPGDDQDVLLVSRALARVRKRDRVDRPTVCRRAHGRHDSKARVFPLDRQHAIANLLGRRAGRD